MYQVRNGQKVALTCFECGCRLEVHNQGVHELFPIAMHYGAVWSTGRDAKGHKCSRVYEAWQDMGGGVNIVLTNSFTLSPNKY